MLCGLYSDGSGTYTAEGINALCEGLKGSAITSLRCARPRLNPRKYCMLAPLVTWRVNVAFESDECCHLARQD